MLYLTWNLPHCCALREKQALLRKSDIPESDVIDCGLALKCARICCCHINFGLLWRASSEGNNTERTLPWNSLDQESLRRRNRIAQHADVSNFHIVLKCLKQQTRKRAVRWEAQKVFRAYHSGVVSHHTTVERIKFRSQNGSKGFTGSCSCRKHVNIHCM